MEDSIWACSMVSGPWMLLFTCVYICASSHEVYVKCKSTRFNVVVKVSLRLYACILGASLCLHISTPN